MTERYLEDYAVAQTFASGSLSVDAAAIKRFAAEFDSTTRPHGRCRRA